MTRTRPGALVSLAGGSVVVTLPGEARGPLGQADIHRRRVRRRLAEARRPERAGAGEVAARAAPPGAAPGIPGDDVCWELCPGAGWSHFELLRSRYRTGATSPTQAAPGRDALRPPLPTDVLEVE